MALADYVLKYELPFKDVDGNQWKVEIYDRDGIGVDVERLNGTGNPVSIYYEGDENLSKGIIGSSCTINLYGTPNMYGTSDLTQFFTDDEEKFYVKVSNYVGAGWSVYWVGFLHQDEYIENIACDPYEVSLVALDRLGTIETTLDSLGYFLDDDIVLKDLLQKFIDETALEFEIEEEVGLISLNGNVTSYLTDQQISLETYIDGEDTEFVKMIPIRTAISNMAVSLNCRVFQSGGRLNFQTVVPPTAKTKDFTIPTTIQPVNNDLLARHSPAARITNISYPLRSRNLINDPSFEKGVVTGQPLGSWNKPAANISDSIMVRNDIVAEGSNQSLRIIASRISDSDFENATYLEKINKYACLQATTDDIITPVSGFARTIQGTFGFRVFVDNSYTGHTYEVRFSLSRADGAGNTLFYDFVTGEWKSKLPIFGTQLFYWGFFNIEADGNFFEAEVPFIMNSTNFTDINGDIENSDGIEVRIHTHNYEDTLSGVHFYYDNFYLRTYNASGDAKSAFLPESKFYNISTDENTETQTGALDLKPISGMTIVEIVKIGTDIDNEFDAMNNKTTAQYVNIHTDYSELVGFYDDPSPAGYSALPTKLLEMRRSYDEASKKIYSSTLKTIPYIETYSNTVDQNFTTNYTPNSDFTYLGTPPNTFSVLTADSTERDVTIYYDITGVPVDAETFNIRLKHNAGKSLNAYSFLLEIKETVSGAVVSSQTQISGGEDFIDFDTLTTGSTAFSVYLTITSDCDVLDSFEIEYVQLYKSNGVSWRPLKFSDLIDIDYSGTYTDSSLKAFTRFGFNPYENRYNIDAVNLP